MRLLQSLMELNEHKMEKRMGQSLHCHKIIDYNSIKLIVFTQKIIDSIVV